MYRPAAGIGNVVSTLLPAHDTRLPFIAVDFQGVTIVELGMVGLGRMGAHMTERLISIGRQVSGFDPEANARYAHEAKGGVSAGSLTALVGRLPILRSVRLTVPFGRFTDGTVEALLPLVAASHSAKKG